MSKENLVAKLVTYEVIADYPAATMNVGDRFNVMPETGLVYAVEVCGSSEKFDVRDFPHLFRRVPECDTLCPKCGEPYGDDPIWPSKGGSEICQMCWEAECSESWWRRVDVFVEAEENAELSRMVKERAGQKTVKVDIDEL